MLSSLWRKRSVLDISYGCIGFSESSVRTARASGLAGRRIGPPLTPTYSDQSIRERVLLVCTLSRYSVRLNPSSGIGPDGHDVAGRGRPNPAGCAMISSREYLGRG